MSDNLVERLRDWEHVWLEDADKPEGSLYLTAADRIEELEAKLAEAVEAGKTMDDGCDCERCNQARATLAELTGGKDE